MIYGQALLVMLGLLHALAAYFYFSKERHAAHWVAAWLVVTALALWQLQQADLRPGMPGSELQAVPIVHLLGRYCLLRRFNANMQVCAGHSLSFGSWGCVSVSSVVK